MVWDSETINTLWGYQPITTPAVSWRQVTNGNWISDDRGFAEDIYRAGISFKGTAAQLATLETVLNSNRETFDITCGVGEEIFGADIDYSGTLSVSVVQYGTIQSVNFGVFTMPLMLRLISPTFTGTASPASLIVPHQYEPNSAFTIQKNFSLDGTAYYAYTATDPGLFRATFRQTSADMKAIRRWLSTTARGSAVSFPLSVAKPFGQRSGDGPFTCFVIDWRDLGRKNYGDWELDITFARQFT